MKRCKTYYYGNKFKKTSRIKYDPFSFECRLRSDTGLNSPWILNWNMALF